MLWVELPLKVTSAVAAPEITRTVQCVKTITKRNIFVNNP